MSNEKSSESTSFSGSGQAWARPYAKRGAQAVFNAYSRAQPTLDRAVAGTENIATDLAGKFTAGQAQAQQARDYWGDVLSGKFLNSNPFLNDIIGSATGTARDAVNANYAGAGRFGSGMHDAAVARETGNIAANLRFGDFNNQMARMDQAASAAAGANAAEGSQALGAQGQLGTLPFGGMNSLSNSLAALFSGGNSHSVSYAPNPLFGALGAGLGAAGALFGNPNFSFSDERLKTKIELLYRDPDGLGHYEWNWKSEPDGERVRGVLAHEVKALRPKAHIPNYRGSGFDGVNYAAL